MSGNALLPSWREGDAKSAVLEFVESVSGPARPTCHPPERIATFDNDGTLWCEKPQYVQADFATTPVRRRLWPRRRNAAGRW